MHLRIDSSMLSTGPWHDLSAKEYISYLRAKKNEVISCLNQSTGCHNNTESEDNELQIAEKLQEEKRRLALTQEDTLCHNLTASQEQLISLLEMKISLMESLEKMSLQFSPSVQPEACGQQVHKDEQHGEKNMKVADLPQGEDRLHCFFSILRLMAFYFFPTILLAIFLCLAAFLQKAS